MLDLKIDKVFGIEATVPGKLDKMSNALLLRTCKLYAFGKSRIISELEIMTFDILNMNQGFGFMDIEFVFNNNVVSNNYPDFYTKCFVLRTDEYDFIKPMKMSNMPRCSKINQDGDLVLGIRYFFNDERDIDKLKCCNSLLLELFIALDKVTNVYGVMCQMEKCGDEWRISSSYTYKPKYAKNIKNLYD